MHFLRASGSGARRLPGFLVGILAATVLAVSTTGCSDDPGPQAGVISTGNAGRVHGSVLGGADSGNAIEGADVVLERLVDGVWTAHGRLVADSLGGFVFRDLESGTYRVTARDAVGNTGVGAPFGIDPGADVRVVVVLVTVTRVRLAFVLADGQRIRSVEMEGSGLRGVPSGDAWILEAPSGVVGVVSVSLETSGTAKPVRYVLSWSGGDPVLSILDPGGPVVVPEIADSSILLADWDFSEPDGTLPDRSGRGNDGTAHGGVALVPGTGTWRFDGTSGYVTLGSCIRRGAGLCADWTDGNVTVQMLLKLDRQTVSPVAHVLTLRSGNGEIMVKRFPGDTLAIGTASPSGFAGIAFPWAGRLGTWVDLVIVRDSATDSIVVHLDGERAGAFLSPPPLHSSSGIPPTLGAYSANGGVQYFAQIVLDRVRMWSGRFDSTQVRALHRSL